MMRQKPKTIKAVLMRETSYYFILRERGGGALYVAVRSAN